jgi:DNA-3-methyladenine glycosylase
MSGTLSQKFFERPTLWVAKELLGKFLVHRVGRREIAGMITEVEAYVGPNDRASHAWRGKTKRTEVMFGKAGHWYVYMIYGMYHCLNIVTEKEEYPAAVLIRSVIPTITLYPRWRVYGDLGDGGIRGPGRVGRYFKIDQRFNNEPASQARGLWVEDRGVKINPDELRRGKRIGVEYAGKWKHKLWRFYLAGTK